MPEVRTTSSTGGQKGTKLARFDLIPVGPLTELAEHYGRGAAKYANHQWRQGYEWSKSYAALMRHLVAFWAGKDYDVCSNEPDNCVPWSDGAEHEPDTCFNHTGSHHMAAVAWHAFLLLEFKDAHQQHDDRYRAPEPESAEVIGRAKALEVLGFAPEEDVRFDSDLVFTERPSDLAEAEGPVREDAAMGWVVDHDAALVEGRTMRAFPRVKTGLPTLDEALEQNHFADRLFPPYDDSWLTEAVHRQVLAADKAVEDRLREQYGPDLLKKRRPIKDTPQA